MPSKKRRHALPIGKAAHRVGISRCQPAQGRKRQRWPDPQHTLRVLAADALDCSGVDGTVHHQLRQRKLGGIGGAGGGGGPESGGGWGGSGRGRGKGDGGAPLMGSQYRERGGMCFGLRPSAWPSPYSSHLHSPLPTASRLSRLSRVPPLPASPDRVRLHNRQRANRESPEVGTPAWPVITCPLTPHNIEILLSTPPPAPPPPPPNEDSQKGFDDGRMRRLETPDALNL